MLNSSTSVIFFVEVSSASVWPQRAPSVRALNFVNAIRTKAALEIYLGNEPEFENANGVVSLTLS